MPMNQSHQLFLQSFMARGLLDAKQVKQLYKISCIKFGVNYPDGEDDRKAELLNFVRTINQNIRPFHMEIKKGVSEDEGVSYYCLVCTNESAITRLGSDYTVNELEFFKKLIECIVESDHGHIGSISAVNITDRLDKKMSKNDAQALLDKLENAKWIAVAADGKVSLATRCLLELEQYILDVFVENVQLCNVCKKLCVQGQYCGDCPTRLHFHCAARFFQNKEKPRCPNRTCGTHWPHEVPKKDVPRSQVSTSQRDSNSRKRKAKP